ncbi:hypothetical protein KBX49_12140 [Liquorilactobacillus satsumensis]|uniref:hypothetical protein n=1 Tax=Liquorilactobacillus satsumensis TaxID=259059 RepID=UPI0021C34F65|nr:hypothetical protein [Liquorilactobacillus satsumensis]MCP9358689.1 hypothetical protein [Liquorilactobacillus satsumensis]MCP9372638.1 hypothetical protein [Liquorilactobacillus satsumensis]
MEYVKHEINGQVRIERGNKPTEWIKFPLDKIPSKGLLQIKPSSFSKCSLFNVKNYKRC